MAQEDTIHDIIERMEQARDRCANASDEHGMKAANQAIADLRDLDPSSLATAHDIEDYFHEQMSRPKVGKKSRVDDSDESDQTPRARSSWYSDNS